MNQPSQSIPHLNDTDYLFIMVPKPPFSAWVRIGIGVALLLSIFGQTSALGVVLDIVLGGGLLAWGGRALGQAKFGSELRLFAHGLVVRDAGMDYYAPWPQVHHVRNSPAGVLEIRIISDDRSIRSWNVWSQCHHKSRRAGAIAVADLMNRRVIPSTFAVIPN
jgi:hypothetical protein